MGLAGPGFGVAVSSPWEPIVSIFRTRPPRGLAALLALSGCGLFNLGRFDQTPPPEAKVAITFEAGSANGAIAAITLLDAAGRPIAASATLDGSETPLSAIPLGREVVFDLGPQDFANLRVSAQSGNLVLKGILPEVLRPAPRVEADPVEGGVIDANTTAAAQLVTKRVQDDGSGFEGTPTETMRALYAKAQDPELAAVSAFAGLSLQVSGATSPAGLSPAPYDAASPDLSAEFLAQSGLGFSLDDYRQALAAAAEEIRIPLVCDASQVAVLFTVDISGRALDGNGKIQLIRQPPREGRVFLAISTDPSTPVADAAGALAPQLTPNDPRTVMFDDGSNGDEAANDGIFSRLLVLPRGMRVLYKYTNGAAGEGFTRTEEWPGNARILQVEDVLTKNNDGSPDCLVIRRDSFGDESSNKNFVNLNRGFEGGGGTLSFDADLGGQEAAVGAGGLVVGGLALTDPRALAALSPAGVPEARENGICLQRCPPPVVAPADDSIPPVLRAAEWIGDRDLVATFSETVDLASATNPNNWLLTDDQGRALRIDSIGAAGARVTLRTIPADFSRFYVLRVQRVTDASADQNAVEDDDIPDVVDVAQDATAPKVNAVLPQSLKDVNPGAVLADPTVGNVVKLDFNEALDAASAQNAANYKIRSEGGATLAVNAAVLDPSGRTVRLVTATQAKGLGYTVRINGVRDISGNALNQSADQGISFTGFALFRVSFGAVVDFAFANADGTQRGLPFGEKLFLTGTPLALARSLDASSISVAGRTDVTGVPQYEMTPTAETLDGAPIFRVELLVPPGVYAWKAAHGVVGEFVNPPATLEKVHKSLATTNDATGVNIDPRTLQAANGIDYTGARLSTNGSEPESPLVMFKRENPDEVCAVTDRDVVCPTILIGTWRDIIAADYDDGQRELEPLRPELPDASAPRLLAASSRDSESVLLSFDEALGGKAGDLEVTVKDADTGAALPVVVEAYGGPFLPSHQVVLRTSGAPMSDGHAYSIRFRGQKDGLGNRSLVAEEAQVLAPGEFLPFTPLVDTAPPLILAVETPSPTEVEISFNERVDPETALAIASYEIRETDSGAPLPISAAVLAGGGRKVRLTTAPQVIEEPYTLSANGIIDLVGNVQGLQEFPFLGFGDRVPPILLRAEALSNTKILLKFDEALESSTAEDLSNYTINGATIQRAEYSGSPALRSSAFAGGNAPQVVDLVLLTTTPLSANQSFGLQVVGVTDTSGNAAVTGSTFTVPAQARRVTVVLEYLVSSTTPVNGNIPSRAISLAKLEEEREGVFIRGTEVSDNGATAVTSAVTTALGTFPAEGQPLTGAEPALLDDGQGQDTIAGDGRFTLAIPNVPLGTTITWKGFASFSTAYRDANPGDLFAAFADAAPGPSVFSDGQEFPGNDNAARILGDANGDGVVRLRVLFGDEATYKRFTGTPAFIWVDEEFSFQ
jgi:hypothetical protein